METPLLGFEPHCLLAAMQRRPLAMNTSQGRSFLETPPWFELSGDYLMRCAISARVPSISPSLRHRGRAWLGVAVCACMLASASAQDKPPAAPSKAIESQSAHADAVVAAKIPDVSKEAVVFDKLITRIREEADGTGTRETTARIRILADAGVKEMAVLAFTYTASNQQVDIGYVRVLKPDGVFVFLDAVLNPKRRFSVWFWKLDNGKWPRSTEALEGGHQGELHGAGDRTVLVDPQRDPGDVSPTMST